MPGPSQSKPGKPALDPVRFLRALRHRRLLTLIACIAALAALWGIDHGLGLLPVDDDWDRYHNRSVEVVRVVDGDTLIVRVADPEAGTPTTRVRLWGVDAPELARPDRGTEAEDFAEDAFVFTRDAAAGATVVLRLQDHRLRGRFGRVLAYVELPDGRDLGAALLGEGLARAEGRWGHDRIQPYADRERAARRTRIGMWSD